jgi:CubicO group peptidase (beta-lactamase class C family)
MRHLIAMWIVASPLIAADPLAAIDTAVSKAIDRGELPGAVVVVVHKDAVAFRKAYGLKSKKPAEAPMTLDTIFDLASLTKPIATGTSIHHLIEAGKLDPSDKVSKHWPEFAANGKEGVTVEHLLLHTSGLTADNAIADYANGKAAAMKAIAGLKLEAPAGTRFKYSDVGFIVLGELVERLGGASLDAYANKHVFAPLKMADTGYTPKESAFGRIAPTGLRKQETILGSVHDPRAFAMGGVAGHAGLFATADDLALYARMVLNRGELAGVRILKEESMKRFTEPHDVPPKGRRSLGWDVDTSYSSPRGEGFQAGAGFGHTGFTGTSIWFEPRHKLAVIVLSNRVHPDDKGNATPLRKEIASIVAAAFK